MVYKFKRTDNRPKSAKNGPSSFDDNVDTTFYGAIMNDLPRADQM